LLGHKPGGLAIPNKACRALKAPTDTRRLWQFRNCQRNLSRREWRQVTACGALS